MSLLERALKNLVAQERMKSGRRPLTRFCIVDAQSVKNTDTAGNKGYDALSSYQLAVRRPRFHRSLVTKILNRF
jgi:hypothetical protein